MSLTVMLVLVLSVVVNVLLVMRLARRKDPPEQNRSVRTAVLQGIQDVSELASVRERFQSIVTFSEGWEVPVLGFNFPGTTRRFMMRYSGTIVCGCDLSKADISERFDVNRICVAVPHSRITDIYADVHSFEVYDQSAGIFTSIRLEDQNREVSADLEEVRRHALKNGILTQADENARRVLTSVVASTGMEAEIIFVNETGTDALDSEMKSAGTTASLTAPAVSIPVERTARLEAEA